MPAETEPRPPELVAADGDIHALDHPYSGLVLEVVDAAPDRDRDALLAWLRDEHVPGRLAGSDAAMCLVFEPRPLPGDRMSYVQDVPGIERRLTLLWLTETDPRDCWAATFAGAGDAIASAGQGRIELAAPFVPTVPGTNTYVDELR